MSLAIAHLTRHGIGELARGMQQGCHSAQLDLAQLIFPQRLPEDLPLLYLYDGRLQGCLHKASGARRRLYTPSGKARHGRVEAATSTAFSTDQRRVRQEEIFEMCLAWMKMIKFWAIGVSF